MTGAFHRRDPDPDIYAGLDAGELGRARQRAQGGRDDLDR